MDILFPFIALIAGWVLGIFQTFIVDKIKQRNVCAKFHQSLVSELRELQFQMALVAFLSRIETGRVDEKITAIVKPIIHLYAKRTKDNEVRQLEELLNTPISDANEVYAEIRYESRFSTGLKSYNMPFFESQLHSIGCLNSKQQSTCFKILMYVKQYNQENSRYWSFFEKTFNTTISGENHEFLRRNIRTCLMSMGNIAEGIITDTHQIIKGLEN
ncbi:MAG: hypothetical protein GY841_21790, partial [FCB group bacterium]|nr:hypothetical protein [FCB group bacterium]